MNQHDSNKHARDHGHHDRKPKALHKHWLTWVVVGLMLAAMLMYVMSDDEALAPGGARMPAEAAE